MQEHRKRQQKDQITRRYFLKLLTPFCNSEQSTVQQDQPEAQRFILGSLKDLPVSAFQRIVPILRQDMFITLRDTAVIFRDGNTEEKDISLKKGEYHAVQMFDGTNTIEQIGSFLDEKLALKPGDGYFLTRSLFLLLTEYGICHPANSPTVELA